MRVRLEGKGQDLTLDGRLLGRGGEASIYAVPGRADLAAKIYHNPTDEHADKLAAMLAAPPVAPPQRGEHTAIAWPITRLLEPPPSSPPKLGGDEGGRVIGYLMPYIDRAYLLWEIYNPGVRRELCPHFHHGLLLRTARNLATVVRQLHECGYVLGDLNESNVLVTPQALVTLIDVDSFQTPGADRLYRCRVGRPEYTPPELQGAAFAEVDRLPQHDAFALAVLISQLLMQGVHPFAGTGAASGEADSIPARIAAGLWPYALGRAVPVQPSPHAPPWFALPPSVAELFRCCFEDAHAEPDRRPSAAQWQHALEEAEHELTSCTADARHVYHRGLDVCPWCVLGRRWGRDPFAPAAPGPPSPDGHPRGASGKPQVEQRSRKVVDDPLPPRPRPSAQAQPTSGRAEMVLQAIGVGIERRGWLVWIGMAFAGALAGFVYALHRALSARPFGP
jgi:DNA-binding helix-hairpin-helix protein with protein kinase domain